MTLTHLNSCHHNLSTLLGCPSPMLSRPQSACHPSPMLSRPQSACHQVIAESVHVYIEMQAKLCCLCQVTHTYQLELVYLYLPEGKYWLYPERFIGWPFWCRRDNVCSRLKFWSKFYTHLRSTWCYPNTSDGQLSSQFQEAPLTNCNSFVFIWMYVILVITDDWNFKFQGYNYRQILIDRDEAVSLLG